VTKKGKKLLWLVGLVVQLSKETISVDLFSTLALNKCSILEQFQASQRPATNTKAEVPTLTSQSHLCILGILEMYYTLHNKDS